MRQLSQKVISRFPNSGFVGDGVPMAVPDSQSIPAISSAARELLAEASNDPQGTIMNIRMMSGRVIQANQRGFIEDGNPRSEARWIGALNELRNHDLIEDRGGQGELFFVTDEGYRIADLLKQE
jgi:hypothetical protein